MTTHKNYHSCSAMIIGAGPAGLAAAIQLKKLKPQLDICVIEKARDLGNHNLSGAVLQAQPIESLLDQAQPDWRDCDQAKSVLGKKVLTENIQFMTSKFSFPILPMIKMAKLFKLGFGQMEHKDDYIVSVSKLTAWLADIARQLDIEVLTGFAAEDIIYDRAAEKATGIKLVDQGLDHQGNKNPNYLPGEIVEADFILLAEGCDGLVTEKFVEKADLQREHPQLYSVGIKELLKVTPEQYEKFSGNRVAHAMGYPIWTPFLGPAMFGGGIIYPVDKEHLAVGMIVGADWKPQDFNPQDALVQFKNHPWVKQFTEGATVVEAGAKMIPEGGYYAIPRDKESGAIGKSNVLILGDSAGLVNMLKIKGLHNALESGIQAAKAIANCLDDPTAAAQKYTELLAASPVEKEMRSAKNFRQTVAKFGPLQGMPLSVFGSLLPKFKVEKDFEAMTQEKYKHKPDQNFDKDTFTAVANTEHREEQPCHLIIKDIAKCIQCDQQFNCPCVTFCPAGVYERIQDQLKAANPSNCLHCKTCQRKCPMDNIRWTVPEGSGGPRYTRM